MRDIIKKRIIKVKGITCSGCVNTIDNELSRLNGVKTAIAGIEGYIYVEYDLNKITFKEIEENITELGYMLSDNFLDKLKKGWYNFSEENELDNLHNTSRSCCTIPDSEFVQYAKHREQVGK